MAILQVRDWYVDGVAWFFKLHYDTIEWREEVVERFCDRRKKRIRETIRWYHIQAKQRPCKILDIAHDHFLVWCGTAEKKDAGSYIPLERVYGLKGNGFLKLHPDEIRWIHRSLAGTWIGQQEREANAWVWEEFNQMMHKAPRRSPQRRET